MCINRLSHWDGDSDREDSGKAEEVGELHFQVASEEYLLGGLEMVFKN